ncbi:MAG: hypothetical protein ACN6N0_15270 [Microvirgula sp.]
MALYAASSLAGADKGILQECDIPAASRVSYVRPVSASLRCGTKQALRLMPHHGGAQQHFAGIFTGAMIEMNFSAL